MCNFSLWTRLTFKHKSRARAILGTSRTICIERERGGLTLPPFLLVFETTIVKSKLYHLPSSARDVDENLPLPRAAAFFFFFKGRDYLLNVVRRLIHLRADIYDSINAADPGFI